MLGMQSVCLPATGIPPTRLNKGSIVTEQEQQLLWRDLMNASLARVKQRAGESNT
jgi:hypothetical protein